MRGRKLSDASPKASGRGAGHYLGTTADPSEELLRGCWQLSPPGSCQTPAQQQVSPGPLEIPSGAPGLAAITPSSFPPSTIQFLPLAPKLRHIPFIFDKAGYFPLGQISKSF